MVYHLLKESGLTHQATPINLTAIHMHILSNQQLQWQPPHFNKTMTTINMQIKIYTLPLLLTGVQFHMVSVVNDGAFCNDDPIMCAYTEPPVVTKQTYDCGPNIATAGI